MRNMLGFTSGHDLSALRPYLPVRGVRTHPSMDADSRCLPDVSMPCVVDASSLPLKQEPTALCRLKAAVAVTSCGRSSSKVNDIYEDAPPAHSTSTALPLATALQLAAQGIPKGWTANMLHLQPHPPAIICDCVLFLLQVLCREL